MCGVRFKMCVQKLRHFICADIVWQCQVCAYEQSFMPLKIIFGVIIILILMFIKMLFYVSKC